MDAKPSDSSISGENPKAILNACIADIEALSGGVDADAIAGIIERLRRVDSSLTHDTALLRSLYDYGGVSVFIADVQPDGDYVYVGMNPLHEKVLGFSCAELIGKTPRQLEDHLGRETVDLIYQFYDSCVRSGEMVESEMYAAVEGHYDWWLSRVQPVRDSEGRVTRLIGNAFVITDRKEAEQALERLQKDLASVIDSMPSMLVGLDGEGKVTHWNSRAEVRTGVPADQAKGRLFSEMLPGKEHEYALVREGMASRQTQRVTQETRLEGCKVLFDEWTVYPLAAGGVTDTVIRIDDVTKSRELEAELNHSRRLDAVGQLAGGIAHDFNNMLAGIIGSAELLLCPERQLDATGKQYVDLVLQAATRAADLTARLLTFGRKAPQQFCQVRLHPLMTDTLALMQQTLDKRVKTHLRLNATVDDLIGESSGLQNVLMNLCINASHAMPEGGEITLSTDNIQLNETTCDEMPFDLKPGPFIEVRIQDTGCGIPSDHLEKIFEPFFTTKEPGKGTGLGLAAVYGTVTAHHGAIQVSSTLDRGTTFRILLPCAPASGQIEPVAKSISGGSGLVLLVDDEDIVRYTGEHMLKDLGYRVLTASGGLEAEDLFRKHLEEVDLVLLDMMMPKPNGAETLARLKALRTDCPVVIVSGFAGVDMLSRVPEADVAGFLRKPYREFELAQILNDLIPAR